METQIEGVEISGCLGEEQAHEDIWKKVLQLPT